MTPCLWFPGDPKYEEAFGWLPLRQIGVKAVWVERCITLAGFALMWGFKSVCDPYLSI